MIGPVAPGATFLTSIDYGSAPTAPGVRLMASDGTTAIARSTTGIINNGGLGRSKLLTAPATVGWYLPKWDDNNGPQYSDEAVWVSTILGDILAGGGGGGGGGTPLPLIGDATGTLQGKTFLIKRNDTLPYLRRQLLDASTGLPVDLTGATSIYFNMRRIGTGNSPDTGAVAPKVHKLAVNITTGSYTPADGIVEYRWVEADTNNTTDGGTLFAGEFEVTFSDGTIETFPQADYIQITIPIDLDPGIDP